MYTEGHIQMQISDNPKAVSSDLLNAILDWFGFCRFLIFVVSYRQGHITQETVKLKVCRTLSLDGLDFIRFLII